MLGRPAAGRLRGTIVDAGRLRAAITDSDRLFALALAGLVAVLLITFVLYPLFSILQRSFVTPEGIGLGNYVRYFTNPRLVGIIGNTFAVTLTATAVTIVLAYGFAYAMHRSMMPGKAVLRLIVLTPLFAPSLVQALGLQFLLGRNGFVNRTFGLDIDIYGFSGIVIADILYSFPHAFLILSTALATADARLYESARTLGATSWRTFRTVTLPASRYGLASAIFVVFTIVITDFGNPVVIGGDYTVLAVEIYNQVAGRANFEMGAVVGVILLLPAALAVTMEKWVARRQYALVTAQSVPLRPRRSPMFDALMLVYCGTVAAAILTVIGIVIYASFVQLWPYNLSLSLRHYAFDVQNGIQPLWTSIHVSLLSAAFGVVFVVIAAYINHKFPGPAVRLIYFLSIVPAAVPGMVLGLGYVLAFNDPLNPVYAIYGTILILVFCNIYHYHAQGFLLATTSMKHISNAFDEASATLGASLPTTLRRITLPIIWPSLVGIATFFFMRSMVTLSAIIFLITPSTQLAAVSVLYLDDRGALNQAAAFAVCIMVTVVAALLLVHLLFRLAGIRGVSIIR